MIEKIFKIKKIVLGLMLCLMLLGCLSKDNKSITLPWLEGEWLSSDYIEILNNTKSPLMASRMNGYLAYIKITHENDVYNIFRAFSFHYALNPMIKNITQIENIKYRLILDSISEEDIILEKLSNDLLKIQYKEENRNYEYRYTRLPEDLKVYINKKIIVGKFVVNRDIYEFFDNGIAYWPNNVSFNYTVNLDAGWQEHDWFRDETNKKIYVYKWQKDKLYIYDSTDNGGETIIPTGNPIILTKIN